MDSSEPTLSTLNPINQYQEPPKTHRALLFSIATLFVLILGGGGAYAYYFTDYILGPEKIIRESMESIADTNTFEFEGNTNTSFVFNIPESEDANFFFFPFLEGALELKSTGAVDMRDKANRKFTFNGDGVFSTDLGGIETNIAGGFDGVVVDNVLYMKVRLPDFIKSLGINLDETWTRLDIAELDDELGSDFTEDFQDQLEIPAKIVEKLREAMEKGEIFMSIHRLPSETINGRSTFHYAVDVDFEKISLILKDVIRANNADFADQEKLFDMFFKDMEVTKNEIWIEKRSRHPVRILYEIKYTIDLGEFMNSLDELDNDDADLPRGGSIDYSITTDVFFKNFGKDIDIHAPENSKTLEETFEEIWNNPNSPLGTSRINAEDATIKANLSSARVVAELYWDEKGSYGPRTMAPQSCSKLVSAKTGMFGDLDMKWIVEDVDETVGAGISSCAFGDKGQSYAISAPLKSKTKHWCVDSLGHSKETNQPIQSAECK